MSVDNLREVLLRKCDDRNLSTLIRGISNDSLLGFVNESLEKMAARKMPNPIVLKYMEKLKGGQSRRQSKMMYDALSHHASQYKAALKGKDEKIANKHAKALFKILHMAQKFDSGQLGNSTGVEIQAPSATPWQKSAYPHDPNPKNFGHKQSFDFLRGIPDVNYKKGLARKLGHEGKAYPLEEITVNGRHIHVDDDAKFEGEFTEHPFDSHPILSHYSKSKVSEDDITGYLDSYVSYHDRNNPESGISKWKALKDAMGENYDLRGQERSGPVHGEVKQDKVVELSNKPEDISGADVDAALAAIGQGGQIADAPKRTRYDAPKPKESAPAESVDVDKELNRIKNIKE